MFRKLQYILATLLTVATCNLAGGNSVYATDISDALIYNSQRFLATEQSVDADDIVSYFVNVYVYENGAYKKLTPDDDFTYTMSDAAGNEYYTLEDYGKYQLTITGTGDYTGSVSQSMYKVEGGNWDNYMAKSFSNIDNDNHVITIMNEAEFALFSYEFNSVSYSGFSGWTFRLNCDLDMSAYCWNPIISRLRPPLQVSISTTERKS